jgi:hypothetical protein
LKHVINPQLKQHLLSTRMAVVAHLEKAKELQNAVKNHS